MKILLEDMTEIDTDDLTSEERHILQKLLCYKEYLNSAEQFREKKKEALQKGWNNSGPVQESALMGRIATKLERDLQQRISSEKE